MDRPSDEAVRIGFLFCVAKSKDSLDDGMVVKDAEPVVVLQVLDGVESLIIETDRRVDVAVAQADRVGDEISIVLEAIFRNEVDTRCYQSMSCRDVGVVLIAREVPALLAPFGEGHSV